jgi:hypothetical protein
MVLNRYGSKSHAFYKRKRSSGKNQERLSKTINSIVMLARITASGEIYPT